MWITRNTFGCDGDGKYMISIVGFSLIYHAIMLSISIPPGRFIDKNDKDL